MTTKPEPTQVSITEPGDWQKTISGRSCPECGTHHSRAACPLCAMTQRLKRALARLDALENP